MADSRIWQILNAIKTKIAGSFPAGYSGVDLSNRVVIGALLDPPSIPYASVNFIDYTSEHGLDLGSYRMAGRFEVYCFIGGSSVEERTKNIMNLSSDIIKALTADRFLGLGGGVIDDTLCNFTAVQGDRYGLENVAIGYIEIICPFQSRSGV